MRRTTCRIYVCSRNPRSGSRDGLHTPQRLIVTEILRSSTWSVLCNAGSTHRTTRSPNQQHISPSAQFHGCFRGTHFSIRATTAFSNLIRLHRCYTVTNVAAGLISIMVSYTLSIRYHSITPTAATRGQTASYGRTLKTSPMNCSLLGTTNTFFASKVKPAANNPFHRGRGPRGF